MPRSRPLQSMPQPPDPVGETIVSGLRGLITAAVAQALVDAPPIRPRLLNDEQAGVYIGRPASTVRRLVREGRIRKASRDTRILVDVVDLDAFIETEKGV